ncbi:MAG: hypothetical protein ACO3LE_09830, partial [Bdellovibrionota bacterium]
LLARTAVHEAGHIIAARHMALGINPLSVELELGRSKGHGRALFDWTDQSLSRVANADSESLRIRRIAFLMAGQVAEEAFLMSLKGNRRLSIRAQKALISGEGVHQDRAMIDKILGGSKDLSQLIELKMKAEMLAKQVIKSHSAEIQRLSVSILERRTKATRNSCSRVLQILFNNR